jgi:hypothetical protein
MAMYSFVPPFHEAKFCGGQSSVFDKLGCAAAEKRLQNTDLDRTGEIVINKWHSVDEEAKLLIIGVCIGVDRTDEIVDNVWLVVDARVETVGV